MKSTYKKVDSNKNNSELSNSEFKKSLGTYAYSSMMNYFLTIFFIFGLMLFLLLLIIISREVLSDANFERHILETKSLLDELERVERGPDNRFERFSSNISEYQKNSIFKRIIIDDLSLSSSQNSNISFITFKTSNYTFEIIEDLLLVSDIELERFDYILYSGSIHPSSYQVLNIYSKGLILDIQRNEDQEIEEIIVLREIMNPQYNELINQMNHNDFFEVISQNQVRGIISLIY